MKTIIKITLLLLVINAFQSCSKDDAPTPEPIAQPEPEPENLSPSSFTIDLVNEKNTAQLSWSEAIDPEGDTVTYSIMLGDSLVGSQTEISIELSDLLFEQEYQGKIIADDGNENRVETPFNFTSGFLWLTQYEQSNGAANGYTYEYDVSEKLTATIVTSRDDRSAITYDSESRLSSYDDVNYAYNNNGLVTTISKDDGLADMALQYDNEDKINLVIINRTDPATNYEARVTISYFYDDLGNLESVNRIRRYSSDNTDGTVTRFDGNKFQYDNEGNMTEIVFTNSEDGVTYMNTGGNRQVFTYDTKKNPTHTLLANQLKVNARIFLGSNKSFDPLNPFSYNIEGFSFIYNRSVHNTTGVKIYLSGELNSEDKWEYDYNASGYPVSARKTFNGDESQAVFPRWSYTDN